MILKTVGLCAVALVVLAAPTQAQTFFFSTNQTIANNKPLDKSYPDLRVGVDEAGKPHETTVDIISPATIDFLRIMNTSTANIRGGTFGHWNAFEKTTINIYGGEFNKQVTAYHDSTINVHGGTFNDEFFCYSNAVTTITKGTFHKLFHTSGGGSVDISGGIFNQDFNVYNNKTITFRGGIIRGNLGSFNESVVNISAGTISGNLGAYASSESTTTGKNIVTLSGGTVTGNILAGNYGTVNISGGVLPKVSTGGGIWVSGPNATVKISGTNLQYHNPKPGVDKENHPGTFFYLDGKLADGTPLAVRYFEAIPGETAPSRLQGGFTLGKPPKPAKK